MGQEESHARKEPVAPFKPREFFFGLVVAGGVVFAVAGARWVTQSATVSAVSSCHANLKQLQGAKDSWASSHGKQREDVPTWNDLVGAKAYIARQPTCPSDGTYTLGPVGEAPRCSVPEHVLQ
jgi:hypothetical protein